MEDGQEDDKDEGGWKTQKVGREEQWQSARISRETGIDGEPWCMDPWYPTLNHEDGSKVSKVSDRFSNSIIKLPRKLLNICILTNIPQIYGISLH